MGLLLRLLQALPATWARRLMRFVGWAVFALGVRRTIALENLRRAFPEKTDADRRALARANYLHVAECAADFLRSPALSDEQLFAMVDEGEFPRIRQLLDEGRGLVAATAHFGNFELFGVWGARRKVGLNILTRTLKGSANARWVATRTLAGIKEIHSGMEHLLEAVRRKEVLALLVDQNMLPKRAVFAPFFGVPAATTPAPAVVAARTGAPVVLALLERVGEGRYRFVFDGPFEFQRTRADLQDDVLAFTAMLNERLERRVRERPEQWFWLHRRWKTRPPGEAPPPKV